MALITGLIKSSHISPAFTISKRFVPNPTSLRPRVPGKHYRLWAMPGDEISVKDILAKQYTFKWHPGMNVGIDARRTLYALCDGIMIITEDKFDPDLDHPLVKEVYNGVTPEYARYIHVIPKHRISEFKLVDVI